MKLYYATGACSLASRISLHEAGIDADFERVDLATKRTASGTDYNATNPAGSVPLLVLDDGQAITENVAVLDLLAQRAPELGVEGALGRTRLIEMLSYLSTELHAAFKPLWSAHGEAEKAAARAAVGKRLAFLEDRMAGPYLFGERFTVADAYLYAMLRWARAFDIPVPDGLNILYLQASERPGVRQALSEEGLD